MRILELHAASAHQRRLMVFGSHIHNARQHRSVNAFGRTVIGFGDRFEQVADAAAVQRRNKVHAGKVDKAETIIQRLFDLVLDLLRQAVPFVHHDHQRAAAVKDEAKQRQILIGDTFTRVDYQQHNVSVFNRLQGFNNRELFDCIGDLAALTHASGINQDIFAIVALHRDIDAVARGARHVVHHHAILAEDTVSQRGLADVGTADDSKLDRQTGRVKRLFFLFFQRFAVLFRRERRPVGFVLVLFRYFARIDFIHPRQQDGFQQAGDATTVRCGNSVDITQPQRVKIGNR